MAKLTYACVELSHQTAPVAVREPYALSADQLAERYADFHAQASAAGLAELSILSTCNRIEFYGAYDSTKVSHNDAVTALMQLLSDTQSPEQLRPHLTPHVAQAVPQHLCRVAAGLESQVLGEPQILGQVTRAYEDSIAHRGAGMWLKTLFQTAIRSGKRARAETEISRNSASISSVAVRLAKRELTDLSDKHVLLVGAGEMNRLALKQLRKHKVGRISLINRTNATAQMLAARHAGEAHPWEALPQLLAQADVVFSATGAMLPVITDAMVSQVLPQRQSPLLLIDMAVPRDIAPEVDRHPNVTVHDIDQLKSYLDGAIARRRNEVPRVETIIAQELDTFWNEVEHIAVRPTIAKLRQKAESVRQTELERALHDLDHLQDADKQRVAALTKVLVNKLLHQPTQHLRTSQADSVLVKAVQELFELE